MVGLWDLLLSEREKPVDSRYVHAVQGIEGKTLVVTMFKQLIGLIHSANYIQVDTTFKRIQGELNEWELTIFCREVNRGEFSIRYRVADV